MMTPDEMIAVLQAYKEGKTIQWSHIGENKWEDLVKVPIWNFPDCVYRIKPKEEKPHYRPFKSAKEVVEAIREHGDWITDANNLPRIVGIYSDGITLVDCFYTYKEMLDRTFADGTPFGVKEE